LDVEDEAVWRGRVRGVEGDEEFCGGGEGADGEAASGEETGEGAAEGWVIVDEADGWWRVHEAAGRERWKTAPEP
jgi:hypothetical protein